jgi:diguanylate cyclase (GGDEF)-like protein
MRLYQTKQQLRANEKALQVQLVQNQALHAELRDQARRDALTGLFNRHHLLEIMDHELARCARDGVPLSLLLIDIDHFKRINDTFGHQMGDDVLRATAHLLAARTRASDLLFRYGGEEFLLVLSPADACTAKDVAEDLRQRYALCPLSPGKQPVLATLSIGVATYADHGSTFDELMRSADEALYRAKNAGRNRVEIA